MGEIYVKTSKFLEMDSVFDLSDLSESGKLKGTVRINGKEYAVVNAVGFHGFDPWKSFGLIECVDLSSYDKELKPMKPSEHHFNVNEGKRDRGYNGQLVKLGKRNIVLTGEILVVYQKECEEQLQLF